MSKASIFSMVVTSIVIALAFALNPSPEQHRAKIKASIAQRNQLVGLLGLGALAAFASTYHPLGVAAYTTVNDRTISVGVFGMVFFIQPSQDP